MFGKNAKIKTTKEYSEAHKRKMYGSVVSENEELVWMHVERQTGENIIPEYGHNVVLLPVTDLEPLHLH